LVNLAILLAAPHRLLFLTGVVQLAATMLWWLAVLSGLYFGTTAPAGGTIPQSLLHAPLLIYLAIPALFFGFLLTVFPRWMGYPDLTKNSFAPVGIGHALAAIASWLGLGTGNDHLLTIAFALGLLTSLWGTGALLSVALRERRDGKRPTWHGWSILAAFMFGIAGQIALMVFLRDSAGFTLPLANSLGLWAFLLPVFVTVCHRMIPFFAANVVQGYDRWRPDWLLGVFWGGTAIMVIGLLFEMAMLVTGGSGLLAALTALMAFRWWPRSAAPALLWVLIIGFAWAPIGYTLAALSSLGLPLGRAPEHALTIGFASSLIIAMVTRVTQGHSGRPLTLPLVGKLAFAGVQMAAIIRVIAVIHEENGPWLTISAAVFLLALAPWTARAVTIYLSPRKDGKAG
jgi:uncharacterized protein involved in response to NO